MNFKRIVLIIVALLSFSITAFAQEEYKIHAGDSLGIKVLRYEELGQIITCVPMAK